MAQLFETLCMMLAFKESHSLAVHYCRLVWDVRSLSYLKQLMTEKNALVKIFERALSVLEHCVCKDDPQRDGCYHCLYGYRQSRELGNISRRAAIRLLKSILSGKDHVERIKKLSDVPVNSLFDSDVR